MNSVVVTGAHGGIGRSICAAFSGAGWFVIGIDQRPDAAENCAAYHQFDFDQEFNDTSFRGLADLIRATLPAPRLTALINNAACQIIGNISELSASDFLMSIKVNSLAPLLLSQSCIDMLEEGNGSIVNISSIHSRQTKPGFSAYSISKAALDGVTRACAVELGQRIRVNAICPAAIETEMLLEGFISDPIGYSKLQEYHPTGKIGSPRDIADAALFLTGEGATFINGAFLEIDGGISSRLHDPN